MKGFRTADEYIDSRPGWSEVLLLLREIALSAGLEETIKWGAPVYTREGKNIVGIGAFKSYAGLWFFQGGLLEDKERKLVNAQEGVTKALRQWRFSSPAEVKKEKKNIRNYILEAIENENAGKRISSVKEKKVEMPEELMLALKADSSLRKAFEKFTPGRQREFSEYIAEPKRPETRIVRLDKIRPMIMAGIGLNDKYKKK